jgi:hypothetical protein
MDYFREIGSTLERFGLLWRDKEHFREIWATSERKEYFGEMWTTLESCGVLLRDMDFVREIGSTLVSY